MTYWRDIRHTVPCDGDDVLGYWRPQSNFGKKHIGVVHYFNAEWCSADEAKHRCGQPDFWMPLPPSPSTREERK